jgi:hypothetical protein
MRSLALRKACCAGVTRSLAKTRSAVRRKGVAVVVFELARTLVIWGGGLYLEHTVTARGMTVRSHFGLDVPVILLGVLLVAVAAAFSVGSELAEERALTV